jgi:hypothetical protein
MCDYLLVLDFMQIIIWHTFISDKINTIQLRDMDMKYSDAIIFLYMEERKYIVVVNQIPASVCQNFWLIWWQNTKVKPEYDVCLVLKGDCKTPALPKVEIYYLFWYVVHLNKKRSKLIAQKHIVICFRDISLHNAIMLKLASFTDLKHILSHWLHNI